MTGFTPTFKQGDLVRLKSGSCLMTVVATNAAQISKPEDFIVWCVWFDYGSKQCRKGYNPQKLRME